MKIVIEYDPFSERAAADNLARSLRGIGTPCAIETLERMPTARRSTNMTCGPLGVAEIRAAVGSLVEKLTGVRLD